MFCMFAGSSNAAALTISYAYAGSASIASLTISDAGATSASNISSITWQASTGSA